MARKLPYSAKVLEAAKAHVLERFDAYAVARLPYEILWKEYERHWWSKATPRNTRETSVFLPETLATCEIVQTRLMSPYLTTHEPLFAVRGREERDVPSAARAEKLYAYQMQRQQIPLRLDTYTRGAITLGTAVCKILPERDVRKTWVWDEQLADRVPQDRVFYDGPRMITRSLRDVYLDPTIEHIQDQGCIIDRSVITWNEWRRKVRDGFYVDAEGVTEEDVEVPFGDSGDTFRREDQVEILEAWCQFDLDGDGYDEDVVITLAGRQAVVGAEPHPFWHGLKPFAALKYLRVPDQFYARGIPEMIYGIQVATNTLEDMRLENIARTINTMLMYQQDAVAPEEMARWVSTPGAKLKVRDINGVKPFTMPDVTGGAFHEQQHLAQMSQNVTGINEWLRGSASATQSRATATEANLKAQGASERIQYHFRVMAMEGFEPIARQWHGLNQQFLRTEQVVRIIGEDGFAHSYEKVGPQDVAIDADFLFIADPQRGDNALRRQQFLNALQVLGGTPAAQSLNWPEVTRRVFSMFQVQEVDKLIAPPPQQVPPQPGMAPPGGPPPGGPPPEGGGMPMGPAEGPPPEMAEMLKRMAMTGTMSPQSPNGGMLQ